MGTWSGARLETLAKKSKELNYRELAEYFQLSEDSIRRVCERYLGIIPKGRKNDSQNY
jgi:Mor family transcriptional regulator